MRGGAGQVGGDGWVAGGVRETLDDALRRAAEARGLIGRAWGRAGGGAAAGAGGGWRGHRVAPEEGLRDASVVWTLVAARGAAEGAWVAVGAALREGTRGLVGPGGVHADGCATRASRAGGVLRPASAPDLRAGLAAWRRAGRAGAVAVGADQSWSVCGEASPWRAGAGACAGGGGLRIETAGLGRVLEVRRGAGGRGEVRVEGGCVLGELAGALAALGLCLPSLPVLLDQTVAGAAATGAHGSSLLHGSLADASAPLSREAPRPRPAAPRTAPPVLPFVKFRVRGACAGSRRRARAAPLRRRGAARELGAVA